MTLNIPLDALKEIITALDKIKVTAPYIFKGTIDLDDRKIGVLCENSNDGKGWVLHCFKIDELILKGKKISATMEAEIKEVLKQGGDIKPVGLHMTSAYRKLKD